MADAAVGTTPGGVASKRAGPRWRRILCAVLAVLACVFAAISVHAVWLHETLLNTDRYVATVGPLAENSAVQHAIANRVSNTLVQDSGLETRVKDALPARASFIAPFVANGVGNFVHGVTLRVVQSPKFVQLWKTLNRRIHTRLVDVLRGQGKFANKNGQVAVNIGPIIDKVDAQLKQLGIQGLSKAGGQNSHQIVLFSSSTLHQVQGGVRLVDDITIALPILTLLLFAGAILASTRRRRTVLRSALGLAFTMLLFLMVWNVLRTPYLNALPASASRAAAGAVYDQLFSFLRLALTTVLVFALIVALGAWLSGPGELAKRIRTGARDLVSRTPGTNAVSPQVSSFVDRHRSPLRALVVGLGFLLLVVLSHPGPIAVVVVALVVLVFLGVIEVLGRVATGSVDPRGAPH